MLPFFRSALSWHACRCASRTILTFLAFASNSSKTSRLYIASYILLRCLSRFGRVETPDACVGVQGPGAAHAGTVPVTNVETPNSDPYIQGLLQKTEEKREERAKARLQDYYRRNFKACLPRPPACSFCFIRYAILPATPCTDGKGCTRVATMWHAYLHCCAYVQHAAHGMLCSTNDVTVFTRCMC